MKKIYYYIDFDGVLLDTNDLVAKEIVNHYGSSFKEIFNLINWNKIYSEAKVINNNLEVLKSIQEELYINILTKVKCLEEAYAKTKYLRENGITCPIIYVPIHECKTNIVIPNKRTVLIDDNQNNITEWTKKGGIGVHFDNLKYKTGDYQTSSLNFLTKYI